MSLNPDDPIVVAVNVASAANVRRTLLALCTDERLRQYTLDFLYRIEPRLGAEEQGRKEIRPEDRRLEDRRLEEWRQDQLRWQEVRKRLEAELAVERAKLRAVEEVAARWDNMTKAQRADNKTKEIRKGTNAVRSSDNITASNPSNTTATITTKTHCYEYRSHKVASAHHDQPLTYPERHRLFPDDGGVNPQHPTARQAPTQTIPGNNPLKKSSSTNKRKAASTLAVCAQCKEAFDTADKNDSTACQHHDGDLECDEESDVWCDYYDGHDGPSRYSEEAKELYPGGFIYSCCGKDGEQDGCRVGRHDVSWTRTKWG
ncbi:hypothetical protein QBC37DRAFT_391426 [Rhypophila decipiens]|uniref:C2H2-type domain-containing protein n=1 Tax=Rhypophila decipiens TaxID=261697 RepID=A0AAN7B406_9PEZI|nr:hypothetical protein QBC37DRAFT_391426 [Rhypophila decipiens]